MHAVVYPRSTLSLSARWWRQHRGYKIYIVKYCVKEHAAGLRSLAMIVSPDR